MGGISCCGAVDVVGGSEGDFGGRLGDIDARGRDGSVVSTFARFSAVSMCSLLRPLDSRNANFFSGGASCMLGSFRNLRACCSNGSSGEVTFA